MSILNKMHQDIQKMQQIQPILAVMPEKKSKQKALLFILIILLLSSSLGLLYLIFSQDKVVKESLLLATKKEQTALPVVQLNYASQEQEIAAPKQLNSASQEQIITELKQVNRALQEQVVTKPKQLNIASQEKVVTAPEALSRSLVEPVIKKPLLAKAVIEQYPKVDLPEKLAVVNPQTIEKEDQKRIVAKTNDKIVGVTKTIPEQSDEGSHLSIKPSQLSKQELAQIHLKEADKAEDKGDFKVVAEKKLQALALLPQLNEVRKSLALYYYGQGDVARAQQLLKHGVAISPDYPDFNLMLSRIALKEGDQQKAFLYLEQNPPEVKGNLDYYASYAILAQKFKKYEQSEGLYNSLLSQQPNNGRWRMSLAIVQDRQDKRELAVKNYKQALLQTDLSINAKTYIKQRLSYLGQH